MELNKTIAIKCKGAGKLPWDSITPFQGNLKDLSKENYEKLKKSILELGFSEPCSVWDTGTTVWALNCHQRLRVIKQMVEQDGYTCPPLPVNYIECVDEQDAKRKVLALTSQYGEMTPEGLHEFMNGAGIDLTYVKDSFRFPEVKMLDFELNFFKDISIEESEDLESNPDSEETSEGNEDKADLIPEKIEPRVKPGESYKIGSHKLFNGDCLEVLKTFPENTFDSLVTDPPAGIAFMGKEWDEDKGGSKQWIEWLSQVMKEALRVLKPGAHGLVWAIPRTSHWTATAIEHAGFEIRDVLTHLFGSGFPKSMDISKAIDKHAGAEREVIGSRKSQGGRTTSPNPMDRDRGESAGEMIEITAPSTPEAKHWQGWGTALKPASEHWILVRKPCSEDTVAANVLKHGTGGINIDASRVGIDVNDPNHRQPNSNMGSKSGHHFSFGSIELTNLNSKGRFPANLVLSHNPDCVEVGSKKVKAIKGGNSKAQQKDIYGKFNAPLDGIDPGYGDADGTETVAAFECTENCAVAALDEQSGISKSPKTYQRTSDGLNSNSYSKGMGEKAGKESLNFGDSGGASRFFYCAKPSKSEKNQGLDHLPIKQAIGGGGTDGPGDKFGSVKSAAQNFHPTVKSTKLMSYLINMVTPEDGILLDCFGGSGTTMIAAGIKGFSSVLIEQSPEYCDIILARAEHLMEKSAVPNTKKEL